MSKALIAKAGLTAASGLTALMMNASGAHAATAHDGPNPALMNKSAALPAATYDGTNPESTGCASDAYTARSSYGKILGEVNVLVELRYSPKCRTTWARVTSLNMPACVTNDDWCGDAMIHRNSDGREYRCYIPGGSHTCYTLQVNDAGVTSWAYGEADDGNWTAAAETGSF